MEARSQKMTVPLYSGLQLCSLSLHVASLTFVGGTAQNLIQIAAGQYPQQVLKHISG